MKETYLIYGYHCKVGKKAGQWKVGLTCQSDIRHKAHRKATSGVRIFDNYLKARFKEGYSFEEVFDYFELAVLDNTLQESELWERIYTDMFDAVMPNGFNLKAGNYKGKNSEESVVLMGNKRKGKSPWNKGKKYKQNRDIESRKKRSARTRMFKSLADSFHLFGDYWCPKLTSVQLIEKIVLEAGEPLHRKEILVKMKDYGVNQKDIGGFLQRATGVYHGRGNVPKENIKIENIGGGMYAPIGIQEFT